MKAANPHNLDHPILLAARPAERVWGGRRIADLLGREVPDGPIGESWEVYGDLPVSQGPLAGRTLDSLVKEFGLSLLGSRGEPSESFPILTKWLDCKDWLSVQVHPDDPLARELTGSSSERGKSEAWYVVDADSQATLIHGLRQGASVDQVKAAEGDAVLPLLNQMSPEPNSLLFTGAGTVHALGPGFLIYEIQQSSDLTYRLYDWGRDRTIHPEASLRCMAEAVGPEFTQDADGLRCRYFDIGFVTEPCALEVDSESFAILAAVQGDWSLHGDFGTVNLRFGQSALLPANLGTVRVDGQGRMLRIGLGTP